MMTRDGETVRCKVTRGALDKLLHDNGMLTENGQQGVFDACRTQIESVASQKYDCSHVEDGIVVVRPEDVVQAGLALSQAKASKASRWIGG